MFACFSFNEWDLILDSAITANISYYPGKPSPRIFYPYLKLKAINRVSCRDKSESLTLGSHSLSVIEGFEELKWDNLNHSIKFFYYPTYILVPCIINNVNAAGECSIIKYVTYIIMI